MTLEEYKKKRRFSKTPEPIGTEKNESSKLKFVIQKHEASRLHYDLRLELNGVLKSWAIPKGPSLNPKDKRLAVLVEDHPIDYLTFEGVIPEGNYGAGNVMVWDIGTYKPRKKDNLSNEKILNEGFKKGHLSFILNGKKLKGEFALAQIRKSPQNWLLIKKGDEYSSNQNILEENLSALSNKTMTEISSVIKSPIEDLPKENMLRNVSPMLATLTENSFDDLNFVFEIKWDGYRAIAEIENGKVNLYSRNNISFNDKFSEIVESLQKINDQMVLDGEVVVLDENGKPNFQLLQNYKTIKKGTLVYYVFDILFLNGKNLTSLTLLERKNILKNVLPKIPLVEYNDHIERLGTLFFEAAKKQQLEGIIAKRKNSTYEIGKRSLSWLKIKTHLTDEAIICGYTKPRGGRAGFGALILGMYINNELTYIGHTGTGFDDKKINNILNVLTPLKTNKSPFNKEPKTNTPVTWVKPFIVCEVKFTEWTKEGVLRHPVFLRLRDDKNAKEVFLLKEGKNISLNKKGNTENKKEIIINRQKLKLTNLNKVFWPEEGYTKGDLINYYDKISDIILPHLINRPQSLHRYPDGIYGEDFYQKNIRGGIPNWIETIKIKSDSEENKVVRYFLCQNKESLIFLINFGCIDLNPWNSQIKKLNNPDYILLDLDPEDIDFDYVVEAALSFKQIFDEIGIKGYPKTSGKTGIHIFIPTNGKYSYDQVKGFAKVLVTLVNKRLPQTTSMVRSTQKRKGKVYLDYLQNIKGQTIASAYSVRPSIHATVSTPLKWEEVRRGLRPTDFTIKNVPKRIEEIGDIFKPVLGKGINLKKAISNLEIVNNF